MFRVIYKPEAFDDILKAAEWYDSQREDLSKNFFDDLDELIFYLETNPYLSKKQYENIRQAPLKRFPYVVLFRIESKEVFIFSVFNCHQNPKKVKTRFK